MLCYVAQGPEHKVDTKKIKLLAMEMDLWKIAAKEIKNEEN